MIYASIIEGEVGGGFCCYFGKQHPNLQALFMGRSFNPNGAGPSITKKLCEKPIFFLNSRNMSPPALFFHGEMDVL